MGSSAFAFRGPSGCDPVVDVVVSRNQVNVSARNVDLSDISGEGAWRNKSRPGEYSSLIDTGVDGGELCRFEWLRKYVGYIRSFSPMGNLSGTNGMCRDLRFRDHQWRDSAMGASVPIWAKWDFKPVSVRLIQGRTELLSGMDTIRKIDIAVLLGGGPFKVGQSEWGTMAFNGNRRSACPLFPTDCAYDKLNRYIGELRNSKIEAIQAQGDFGWNLPVREFYGKATITRQN